MTLPESNGGREDVSSPATPAPRTGTSPLALFLYLVAILATGRAVAQATALPVLRTARQVHILTEAEARRNYPVHLAEARITFCDVPLGALFLADDTDGIFADVRGLRLPPLRAGDVVTIDAVSGTGKVNPVLIRAHFRILRHAVLPQPPVVSFDKVLSGADDSRWISLEGIVRSIRRPSTETAYAGEAAFGSSNLILTLSSGPDLIDVITHGPVSPGNSSFIDARVRLSAAVGSRFNQRNQLIGVHVYMPDFSFVQVLDPPPPDPFAIPVTDTAGVMRRSLVAPGHRVHVRGVVTGSFGSQFSIMDARHGIFVHSSTPVAAREGELLDVVGFPSMGEATAVLEDAVVRRIGKAPPPPPVSVTAAEAIAGDHDAEPIRIEGRLLYRSRTPSEQRLVLTENGTTFSAALPADSNGFPPDLQPDTRLRLTGICYIEVTPEKTPKALVVLLRSPADLAILERPSWWTAGHTLMLSGILSAVILVVAAWNFVLRRRVRAQTRVIRAQLNEAHALREQAEAAHHEKSASLANILSLQRDLLAAQEKLRFQATHDALTGLWNRGALLDLLYKEMERVVRTGKPLGILMLDIDNFKPINDTHGHLAGDAVLREFGSRILRATRPYDVAGRYGGEEFLVILPECDRDETLSSAERIRGAIAAPRFRVCDAEILLTVSIGATVTHAGAAESELLTAADAALYQAKSEGRNRTVLRAALDAQPARFPVTVNG